MQKKDNRSQTKNKKKRVGSADFDFLIDIRTCSEAKIVQETH